MSKEVFFKTVDGDGTLMFKASLSDFTGKQVKITIEDKKKRSLSQNGFYWGNFIQSQIECFKERWGETYRKEQVHDWNKVNFWGTEHISEDGEVFKMPCSSTNFTTAEWEEKLENVRAWFKQNFEWEIGYPNEQNNLEFNN
jgi:hypothetical protein